MIFQSNRLWILELLKVQKINLEENGEAEAEEEENKKGKRKKLDKRTVKRLSTVSYEGESKE